MANKLMPVLFLSHGSGAGWLLDGKKHPMVRNCDKNSKSTRALQGMIQKYNIPTPKAVLVVSAHWVEDEFTVCTDPDPGILYDYMCKMPEEAYHFNWTAPGSPEVALRTKEVLEQNGLVCKGQKKRGLDHGVFVPFYHIYPGNAESVPIFQLSLKKNFDPGEHQKLGESLQQLRNEGVLIVGSGNTTLKMVFDFFNRTALNDTPYEVPEWCSQWRDLVNHTVSNKAYSAEERKEKFAGLMSGDRFQKTLYRGDQSHFCPLMTVAGAAGYVPGELVVEEIYAGQLLASQYIFY